MIIIATIRSGKFFAFKYSANAPRSHSTLLVLLGYFKTAKEKIAIVVHRNLVNASKMSVARVATGFIFPINLENLEE